MRKLADLEETRNSVQVDSATFGEIRSGTIGHGLSHRRLSGVDLQVRSTEQFEDARLARIGARGRLGDWDGTAPRLGRGLLLADRFAGERLPGTAEDPSNTPLTRLDADF